MTDKEHNILLGEYLDAVAAMLGQVLGSQIGNPEQAREFVRDSKTLPLGFREWFLKHGFDMLSGLACARFRAKASGKFLDELDYYLMILRDDMGEQDNESVCSDLVASLTRISKLLAAESCRKEAEPEFCDNNCFLTGL